MLSGATVIRITAAPLLLLSVTGWIPDKYLVEIPSKTPDAWPVSIGLLYFVVGVVLLCFPSKKSLSA